jgi:hypothetical protein
MVSETERRRRGERRLEGKERRVESGKLPRRGLRWRRGGAAESVPQCLPGRRVRSKAGK